MQLRQNLILHLSVLSFTIFSCADKQNSEKKIPNDSLLSQTAQINDTEAMETIKIGGKYSFGENIEEGPVGSVIVYPLTNNSALFFLDVCRGAPSYNLGQLFGQMTINGNTGTYDSRIFNDYFDCIFKFNFSSNSLIVTTESEHNDCGFGAAVFADNEYRLIDKSIPEYFIDGHGDTTFFEGLTVEKYEHRFDNVE